MITIEEAYRMALKEAGPDVEIRNARDYGDAWGFGVYCGGMILPGVSPLLYSKTDGEMLCVPVPPMENLAYHQAAIPVPLPIIE